MEALMDIRDAQKRTWDNKLAKGFNTTKVAFEFGLLTAEVGEAFTAWRKGLADFGEELADVALYVMSLAEITGVDLQAEVEHKLAKNEQRVYRRNENGVLLRASGDDGVPSLTQSR